MNSIHEIVKALAARRSGSSWMARCPAHEDRNPSLSIRAGRDGQVLVHCHAGCEQRDVIAALQDRGLWESSADAQSAERYIVATYDYTDKRGELLYQVVRFEPKDFRPRYPDGRGGWIWKKHPHQVLYRLREVLEAPIVFVTEGERDAETLREWGFVATTNAGGAKASWLPEYTDALGGREVIIWPDDDEPGRARAVVIARALLGHAAKISVLLDMGAKDASEWFDRGHSECELIAELEGSHAG
jgi:putative DNA primase/helicase